MTISAEEFGAGAQQLAQVWSERLPGEPPWRWLSSDHPFAASQVRRTAAPAGPPAVCDLQQQQHKLAAFSAAGACPTEAAMHRGCLSHSCRAAAT